MDSKRIAMIAIVVLVIAGFVWIVTRPVDDGPADAPTDVSITRGGEASRATPHPSGGTKPEGDAVAAPLKLEEEPAAEELAIPDPVDLRAADRDLDLFGIVVDAGGKPVAGASLQTISYPHRQIMTIDIEDYMKKDLGPATLSASDGTFALRLERAKVVNLQATKEGYARTVLPMCNAGEQLRVVLGTPCKLRVKVRTESGPPVSGAKVKLWLMSGTDWMMGFGEEREASTDAEGVARFDDLDAGSGWMQIGHPAHGGKSEQVSVKRGVANDVDVTLGGGKTVKGTVSDAETGDPIAGAKLRHWWGGDEPVITDAEGRYELSGVGGQFMSMIVVTADGYASLSKSIPAEGDLDFDLVRGETAHGTVVDVEGAPLSGVRVAAVGMSWDQGGQEMDSVSAISGADGTFRLQGLHSKISHAVVFTKRKYGRLVLTLDHAHAIDGKLDLGVQILPSPRSIEGYAITDTGQAVAGAVVMLSPKSENDDSVMGFSMEMYGRTETRRTDDLGRFRFPELSPGAYTVSVRPTGAPETKKDVTLPADQDLLDVEVIVKGGKSLTVIVVDEGGAPLPGVYVYTYGGDVQGSIGLMTGPEGRAQLTGLPDKEITVSVGGDQRYLAPDPRPVRPRGQEERFVLKQAAVITGWIRDEKQNPIGGLSVQSRAAGEDQTSGYGFSQADGSFSVSVKPGDVVDLSVSGSPMAFLGGGEEEKAKAKFYSGELKGVAAPAKDVVIVVGEGKMDRTLTVLVIDAEGKPIPAVRVSAYGMGMIPSDEQHLTDETGRVTLKDLPPTQVYLSVMATPESGLPDDSMGQKSMQVVPDNQEVTVQLAKSVEITGMVVDGEGNPVPRASIMAGPDIEPIAFGQSDETGKFKIKVPGKGTYRLKATVMDGQTMTTGEAADVEAPSEGVTLTIGS